MDGDLLMDLLVETVDALAAAHGELEALRESEHVPMPDTLLCELEQRDALAATLRRVRTALPHRQEELERVYKEEFARTHREDDLPPMPVRDEVMTQLAAVQEILRRARLVHAELNAVLPGERW